MVEVVAAVRVKGPRVLGPIFRIILPHFISFILFFYFFSIFISNLRMILPHLISFILFFYFFSILISDLRMILAHLISVIVEISPCL